MAERSAFSDPQSGYDHYTRPYDHIMRIGTTLANTAARLYDAADQRPKSEVTTQLMQGTAGIRELHRDVVQVREKGEFQEAGVTERLKIGSYFLEAARDAFSHVEGHINKVPHEYGSNHPEALKVIAAQEARLDGVLKEHHERQQVEAAKSAAKTPTHLQASDAEFPSALSAIAANARPAQIESGTYQGTELGVTDSLVLQQITSRSAIMHQKQLLDTTPEPGQNASIRYCNGTGSVKALKPLARENGLSR